MTPRRTAYLCTYPIEQTIPSPDGESLTIEGECGRIARATYHHPKKGPRQGEIYDRCARHDTAKVQADATRQGFERLEL